MHRCAKQMSKEKEKALAAYLRKNCNQKSVCNDICTEHCRANIVARKQAQLFYAGWDAAMEVLKNMHWDEAMDLILNNKTED